jgi:hypothetical protein
MSSAVETSRDVTVEPGHGVESLAPRKMSGLRCSLDFVRNGRYEMLRPH